MRATAALLLVPLLFVATSRGQEPPGDLKDRIEDLKRQIAEKKAELAKLEADLARLDPSNPQKIQGKWRTIEVVSAGAKLERDVWVHLSWEFNGKSVVTVAQKAGEVPYTLLLDSSSTPAQIDLVHKNPKLSLSGIYKFEGEKLVICLREGTRPRTFDSTEADGSWLVTLDPVK
ncbi:TIGR03067 domain-containing protein [Gemmata sp. JC717]|uniref:TIGR03067 domain-containing protein n=1 Tax=Gemmata algarum TaxID=2975278 RepID=UPI0021BB0557|nr:TIGR03067 domain-containing protein [Gemmata algarum]MDY3554079.1 TIGR03067 domain-containing protein [Gemmata algarum]